MRNRDLDRLARKAGFVGFDSKSPALKKFARLIVEAERKKISKLQLPKELVVRHVYESFSSLGSTFQFVDYGNRTDAGEEHDR